MGCGSGPNSSLKSTPVASVTSGSLTFDNQALNTTSPMQSVTLTNTGGADLSLTRVSTSGDFAQTSNCAAVLHAGASCTVKVTFRPTALGDRTGTVSFADNSAQSPQLVRLYGSGVNAASLTESPSSVSFGTVSVGQTSSQTVTITNNGGQSVNLTAVSTSGQGIGLSGVSTPLTLAPGQSTSFNVSFAPSSSGAVSGAVSLTNDSATPTAMIPVTGTGAPAVAHQVVLEWSASSSQVAGYNTYRSTSPGGPYTKLSPSPSPQSSFIDGNVTPGSTYFYVVTSVGTDMTESSYSNQAQAVVPAS